jgi:hypothetical protein
VHEHRHEPAAPDGIATARDAREHRPARRILTAAAPRSSRTAAYDRAVAQGRLACFIGLQGANGIAPTISPRRRWPTSARHARAPHALVMGRRAHPAVAVAACGQKSAMVEALRDHRVLLDPRMRPTHVLGCARRAGRDARIVSHRRPRAHDSWRNIDDAQIAPSPTRVGSSGSSSTVRS